MSALVRRLHPLPSTCRAYSSFFSSKPGGGRYFNSAKPPKAVVVAKAGKVDPPVAASTPSSSTDPSDAIQGPAKSGSTSGPNPLINPDASESRTPQSSSTTPSPVASAADGLRSPLPAASLRMNRGLSPHPVIPHRDLQLHQFFSLHRPLLLLANPLSILMSAPASAVFYSSPAPTEETNTESQRNSEEDEPEDKDAAAALQLNRALIMHRAGAKVAWDNTLRELGVNVDPEPDLIEVERWNRWEGVMMDSTKRKRRKKMKKHKLKKRRRLTRATRLKLR